jgi:hypothetical protein
MVKVQYTLKVERAELQRWNETAAWEGISTAEWIRRCCSRPLLIDPPTYRKPCKHGLLFCKKCPRA